MDKEYTFDVIKIDDGFHVLLDTKLHPEFESDSFELTKLLTERFMLEENDLYCNNGLMANITIVNLKAWSERISNYVHEVVFPKFKFIIKDNEFIINPIAHT